jgi:hypothetical protein
MYDAAKQEHVEHVILCGKTTSVSMIAGPLSAMMLTREQAHITRYEPTGATTNPHIYFPVASLNLSSSSSSSCALRAGLFNLFGPKKNHPVLAAKDFSFD